MCCTEARHQQGIRSKNWDYMKAVMFKMGFDELWMAMCVEYVDYSILVNNEAVKTIIPGHGLRQSDALSPYLFIICA